MEAYRQRAVAVGSGTVRAKIKSQNYMAPITAGPGLLQEGERQRQLPSNSLGSAKNEYSATGSSKDNLIYF